MTYVAKVPPAIAHPEADKAAKWARGEFETIMRELLGQDWIQLKVQHNAPKKPRAGMIIYADGTDWNPGSGEGVYRYSSALTWVLLG